LCPDPAPLAIEADGTMTRANIVNALSNSDAVAAECKRRQKGLLDAWPK